MKNKIICGLVTLAFFLLGTPIDSDAHGRGKGGRGHYKQGYRTGYRQGYQRSYHAPRYYAPRPVYRGYSYARPGRVYGARPVYIAPAPARAWVPARKAWGQRGWYWRPGYYVWR